MSMSVSEVEVIVGVCLSVSEGGCLKSENESECRYHLTMMSQM